MTKRTRLIHECKECGGNLDKRYKTLFCGYKCWKAHDPVAAKAAAKLPITQSRKYASWMKGAADRGIQWHLSMEEFLSFWGKPCTYCGSDIETVGIDRVDNKIGYRLFNCAPCCGTCNMMKGWKSPSKFILGCISVARFWEGRELVMPPESAKKPKPNKRKKVRGKKAPSTKLREENLPSST